MIQLTKNNIEEYLDKLNSLAHKRNWIRCSDTLFNIWSSGSKNILLVLTIKHREFKIYNDEFQYLIEHCNHIDVIYKLDNYLLEIIGNEFPLFKGTKIMVDHYPDKPMDNLFSYIDNDVENMVTNLINDGYLDENSLDEFKQKYNNLKFLNNRYIIEL